MSSPTVDLDHLSLDERLDLLDRLWASLDREPASLPLTRAQVSELDRRLDTLEAGGPKGIPWDDVLQQIRRRRT